MSFSKRYPLLLLCVVLFAVLGIQSCQSTQVDWLTWQEGDIAAAKNDKKVLVWVYDETCETCIEAEQRIFTSNNAAYINQYFHAIKFEAHSKEPITVGETTYNYKEDYTGNYHELAVAITKSDKEISFPKLVFLNNDMGLIAPLNGNIESDELELLLSYVRDDHYLAKEIAVYKNEMK